MTRVIHTGDTHIGYQQYNAPERRRDFLEAFRGVVEDAVAEDVDAVVHAGDLFHDRRPDLVDLQGTVEVLRELAEADIPFLAVVGNHESKRDAQWLDLFADLGLAIRLDSKPRVVGDAAFYGLDFVPRSRREDLDYEFESVPDEAEAALLVSHGLFEPFAHADWDTERLLSETTVDFDAVLLGDNHKPDTAQVEGSWVTYCGSTERTSASEREDRGYNLVTVDDEVAISRRSVPDTREFVFVDVELAEGEGIDRVHDRVREYDLEDAVVIVTVEGDGRPITPAAVEELALERGALVARVNDRRELPEEDEELSVQFADPDAVVRERVRELGLSDAGLALDRTVRDDELPDVRVRETVERRVRELLEDDRGAFEPAPDRDPEDVTTMADVMDGDDEADDVEGTDGSDETDDTDGSDTDGSEGGDGEGGETGDDEADKTGDGETDEEPSADAATEGDPNHDETAPEDSEDAGDEDGDGQVTMGDFA